VAGVSYWEAEAYAAWAGKRLLSDRQWRWVVGERVGVSAPKYPWGTATPDADHATYFIPAQPSRRPTPVGSMKAGATREGIHDLAGNLWEWLADPHPHRTLADHRLIRGGSFRSGVHLLPIADSLDALMPFVRRDDVGFRCVYSPGHR
jgi:iron(II)-dependent oxidoreductase